MHICSGCSRLALKASLYYFKRAPFLDFKIKEATTTKNHIRNRVIMPTSIGIIYPPPEVRLIVDKTATFVARNGHEFEEKIRANEISNPKFNFLNPNDPYHAYYQHKVKEIAEGKTVTPTSTTIAPSTQASGATNNDKTSAAPGSGGASAAATAQMQKLQLSNKVQDTQARIMEQMIVLKDPPPEYEFLIDAPPISPMETDVIKLTAQFIARNGRPFLTNLMSKEQRNPMFDFLKPQHSHFNYFTKLVDHYTKILLPPRDLMEKLRKEVENPFVVLKAVQYRVEWERAQQREKQREDELAEKERVAYAQIDWHDFVVVETVDYQPGETGNFPPPTTPQDVGARVIAQERLDSGLPIENAHLLAETIIIDESRVATEVSTEFPTGAALKQNQVRVLIDKNIDQVAMDEDSDEERETQQKAESAAAAVAVAAAATAAAAAAEKSQKESEMMAPPQPGNIIIRKDYDPKAAKQTTSAGKKSGASNEEYFKSPLTGELIPASMMSEHMRISMLDPRWLEQKQREKKDREEHEEVLASGINIEKNLKRLAEYRTDMFGSGAEETLIGRKKGDEEKRREEQATWDGHTSTADVTSKRAMTGISVEDQIKAIHHSQGLLEDSSQTAKMNAHQAMMGAQIKPPIPGGSVMIPPPPMPPKPLVNLAPPVMSSMPPPLPSQTSFVAPPPIVQPLMEDVLPASKRLKTGEDSLLPESEFLALHDSKGPVTFFVQVPHVPDKPEWNLNGQTISLVLPLSETVATIKNKLFEQLSMPIAKQKLQLESMFIKDTNTLAFYNVLPNTTISLQLKERGGRKK